MIYAATRAVILCLHPQTLYWAADGECKALSWGKGEDGQLGHGDGADVRVPTVLHALDGKSPSRVLAGADYTIAICDGGDAVYSFGWYCPPRLVLFHTLSCLAHCHARTLP